MYISTIFSFVLHIIIFIIAYLGLPEIKKNIAKEQPIEVFFELPIKSKTFINQSSKDIKKYPKKSELPPPDPKRKPRSKLVKEKNVKKIKILKTKKEIQNFEKLTVIPRKKPKIKKINDALPKKIPLKKKQTNSQKKEMARDLLKTLSKVKEKKDMAKGILKNLAKANEENQKKMKVEKIKEKLVIAANISNIKKKNIKLGLSEIDMLRLHVQNCWNAPYGSLVLDTPIDLLISTEPNGSVLEVKIVDEKSYLKNPVYRATADSARRAVIKCSPLPLPEEKYESWKKFIFAFKMNRD